MTTQELLEAALRLDPGERARLVEQLMESLIDDKAFDANKLEHAWLAELQRRSAAIDAGTAELVDWHTVRSRIAARRARP